MSGALVESVTPDSLASFETPHVEVEVVPIRWSIEKHKVAQMIALEGKTQKAIAEELGIPLGAIKTWLKHPEYRKYIARIVTEGAQELKTLKLQLLTKTLRAREEEAEKNGYSNFSNKDSLDIIAEIRKETGEERVVDSGYTSMLEKLITNSMKQPKTIVVEDI